MQNARRVLGHLERRGRRAGNRLRALADARAHQRALECGWLPTSSRLPFAATKHSAILHWYELQSAAVLSSEAYLARLNAPTPWSKRIMPILRNFVRGGGRVLAQAGAGHGGLLAVIKLDSLLPSAGAALVDSIVAGDRIITAQLLETDQEQTAIQTQEKGLRERDGSFAGLLLIDGLDEHTLVTAVTKLGLPWTGNLYTQVFQL